MLWNVGPMTLAKQGEYGATACKRTISKWRPLTRLGINHYNLFQI